MRNLTLFAFVLLSFLPLFGCDMITINTPFANIDKLGTFVGPENSISITNDHGIVVIEYMDSLKRRITWNGESRTVKLHKSLYINGVFNSGSKIHPPLTGGITNIEYYEGTPFIDSEKYLDETLLYMKKLGYEYREGESIVVRSRIREMDKKIFLHVGIKKLKVRAVTPNTWNN